MGNIVASEYGVWIKEVKQRFKQAQVKASVKVNTTLLEFYWELGADIVRQQKNAAWGSGFLPQLSRDLMTEFPDVKGFSTSNIKYIRRWYLFYNSDKQIGQQAVDQLMQSTERPTGQQVVALITRIPWGHNLQIVSKCNSIDEALYYVQGTVEHGWSRNVLVHQIESGLWQRKGKATTNFSATLPPIQSDLAQQTIKDPYLFDFLTLREKHSEKDLEDGLIEHVTQFLLELGAGFAYVGKQVHLEVGEKDFYIDLLFYHLKLHAYVVIELKAGEFKPEHTGQLSFYMTAVDKQVKTDTDTQTIGLLLCKNKNRVVAEYALSDIQKPIGVSEYQLTQSLPDNLKSNLPSIEELEAELKGDLTND